MGAAFWRSIAKWFFPPLPASLLSRFFSGIYCGKSDRAPRGKSQCCGKQPWSLQVPLEFWTLSCPHWAAVIYQLCWDFPTLALAPMLASTPESLLKWVKYLLFSPVCLSSLGGQWFDGVLPSYRSRSWFRLFDFLCIVRKEWTHSSVLA